MSSTYQTLIAKAELMAMAPEAVATFLRERAANDENRYDDPVDRETEAALRGRNDPLINLALAKYARSAATLLPLFESREPGSAIRLAVLSNTALEYGQFAPIGLNLFADRHKAVAWLVSAPDTEIEALFENPKLHDDFLRGLLKREKPWDVVPEERLCTFVGILARNKRMRTPYNRKRMDGYAEYSHGAVFDAAWSLAERVEPSQQWAFALCWLFVCMQTDAFSIKKPLTLAARWYPDPSNTKLAKEEAEENQRGYLSSYQGVRKGLARLALSKEAKILEKLLASDDPAFRSAAYAEGKLTSKQLYEAYDKDGELYRPIYELTHFTIQE